jgi:hypothetical protein
MIDKLVEVTDKTCTTQFTISAGNVFSDSGFFYEGGLIENIAQTAAAGAGYRAINSGGAPKIGVIGTIKNLTVVKRPQVGALITTVVNTLSEFNNALVIEGIIKQEGIIIAGCQMNIFIIDKPEFLTS